MDFIKILLFQVEIRVHVLKFISSLLFNTGTSGNSGIVILHMGDYDLINFMKSAGGYNMVQIDRSTQNYDPFFWRTEDEIIMLISKFLFHKTGIK